jgi:hypothetical protein
MRVDDSRKDSLSHVYVKEQRSQRRIQGCAPPLRDDGSRQDSPLALTRMRQAFHDVRVWGIAPRNKGRVGFSEHGLHLRKFMSCCVQKKMDVAAGTHGKGVMSCHVIPILVRALATPCPDTAAVRVQGLSLPDNV